MLKEVLAAAVGVLGIGVLFNVRGKNLFLSAIGGGIGWLVYKIFIGLNMSIIPALFLASICISTYSEICARKFKTPVTVFLIGSLIPLVPGGAMYYTMYAAVQGYSQQTWDMMLTTLGSAAIIAFGVVVVSTFIKIIKFIKERGSSRA